MWGRQRIVEIPQETHDRLLLVDQAEHLWQVRLVQADVRLYVALSVAMTLQSPR